MADAVQVIGLETLQASLRRLASELPDVAPAEVAQVIGQRAVSAAPKRTGALAASWAPSSSSGVVQLRFGAVYAGAVHFGVGPRIGLRGPHNIRANPFLWRAVEETQQQWEQKYSEEIETLLDKVKGA